MSYDLIFVPKADDQTWDDALAAAEEDDGDDLPSGEVWMELLAAARQVIGDVSVFEGDYNFELTHEPSGVQLSYYSSQADITVPYWYRAEDAQCVVTAAYRLGEAVQAVTGLCGYDPQLDLPLPDAVAHLDLAVTVFDQVAVSLAPRGGGSPSRG